VNGGGRRERGKKQWGEMAQTKYTHMNKCINNKKRNQNNDTPGAACRNK
jgi:hypothetical protein